MIDMPKTLEEARKYRYGQWAGNEAGRRYVENRCAYEIIPITGSRVSYQCTRRATHGLYCKTHIKYLR